MLPDKLTAGTGRTARNHGDSDGTLPVGGAVAEGRMLDELCKPTGQCTVEPDAPRQRKRAFGAIIKAALVALWEASGRILSITARLVWESPN